MGLLDAILSVIVISIVCYIIIMMYRRSCTVPSVPRNKDLLPPGASSFEDRMTDDQVRAFHELVTSSGADKNTPSVTT